MFFFRRRPLTGITRSHRFLKVVGARRNAVAKKPPHFHVHRNIRLVVTRNTSRLDGGNTTLIVRGDHAAAGEFRRDENRHLIFLCSLLDNGKHVVLPLGTYVSLSERL